MPELPEVETVRRTLQRLVVGKTIERVDVRLARIVQYPEDTQQFCFLLTGQTIRDIERRGKFLRFIMDDVTLVSHLRMEGRYGLYAAADEPEPHTHVVFGFTDGTELRYKDVRQFGTMHVFPLGEDLKREPLKKLGLEPLEPSFTPEALREALKGKTGKLKPVLLNQAYIAGIGNIYVDESLFLAGLHPERLAGTLSKAELTRLYEAIVQTLQASVEVGGSSIKSYVNGQGEIGLFQHQLQVYGREGEPCVRCGQAIEKTVVGGRGTHTCPNCQPLGKRRARKRD